MEKYAGTYTVLHNFRDLGHLSLVSKTWLQVILKLIESPKEESSDLLLFFLFSV